MSRDDYRKEQELVSQLLQIDDTMNKLAELREEKIRELAIVVKHDMELDKEMEVGGFWEDVENVIMGMWLGRQGNN